MTCRHLICSRPVAYPIKLSKKGVFPCERPFTWRLLPHLNKRGLRSDTHKWNRKSDNSWSDPEQQFRRKTKRKMIEKSDGHCSFLFRAFFQNKNIIIAYCATFSWYIVKGFAWWRFILILRPFKIFVFSFGKRCLFGDLN